MRTTFADQIDELQREVARMGTFGANCWLE